jgi:probable HAF family extracellular repeat protein
VLERPLSISLLLLTVWSCGDTATEPTPVEVALAKTSRPEVLRTIDLSPLPEAWGINARSQVVCTSYVNGPRAFVWEDGVLTNLGSLPPWTHAEDAAINNRGQIVGGVRMAGSLTTAVLWTR